MDQERKFREGDGIVHVNSLSGGYYSYIIVSVDVKKGVYNLKSPAGVGFTSFQNEHLWKLSDEGVVARILGKYYGT